MTAYYILGAGDQAVNKIDCAPVKNRRERNSIFRNK